MYTACCVPLGNWQETARLNIAAVLYTVERGLKETHAHGLFVKISTSPPPPSTQLKQPECPPSFFSLYLFLVQRLAFVSRQGIGGGTKPNEGAMSMEFFQYSFYSVQSWGYCIHTIVHVLFFTFDPRGRESWELLVTSDLTVSKPLLLDKLNAIF